MLTAYGHAQIEWRDVKYNIAPSFVNIAKIGSPTEIIAEFERFITATNPVWKFATALNVVNACCDIPLPVELTGDTEFIDGNLVYNKPSHDLPMFDDIIVFAEHCFIHGVCGKTNKKQKSEGDPLKEFDAYSFMELARVHLGLNAQEAANMTMTEFTRMMDAKFPPVKEEGAIDEEVDEQMLAWFEENN